VKALVLAGGAGTRLGEATRALPKPMLPVGGRPFLEYLLDRLVAGGAEELILSVHHRAQASMAHFGSRYRGVRVRYAVEAEPLGTGGAIAYALRDAPAAPVLVANGDSFLALDYAGFIRAFEREPVRLALVVREVEDAGRYGAVRIDGTTVTGFAEKGVRGPGCISAGTYILDPGVFREFGLAGRFSLETDLLQRHCAALRPRACFFDGYFIDIGVPADLQRARRELPGLTATP
jgi:D-glycero-alpha-D-manno-heptose 1-phosphate guanylyltransferase